MGIVDARDLLVSAALRPPWSGVSRSPRHTGPSQGRMIRKGWPPRVATCCPWPCGRGTLPANARAPAYRARGV